MKTTFRIAAAVAAAALAAPALASDPTQPAILNDEPMTSAVWAPAIALNGSGRVEAEALNADPTQPRFETAAPAAALGGFSDQAVASAIVNDEPMTSAVRAPAAPSRVAGN